MKNNPFYHEADLMIRLIPVAASEGCFALKGGTAINFFWRDMPRLSVDIDLTYLPIENRDFSLSQMSAGLDRMAHAIENTYRDLKIRKIFAKGAERISKLAVMSRNTQVKIEPNEILRGSVFESTEKNLCAKAENTFEKSASIKTLSFADLYGGKICAALDRQHPRDIFDMKILLENEGITPNIRKAFVVYLAGHDRPMNELLNPVRHDFEQVFRNEFSGMTLVSVTYRELVDVRKTLISQINRNLTSNERQFLPSMKEGNPKWDLSGLPGIETLPALQWKLANIRKMPVKKHAEGVEKLRKILAL